MLYAKQTKKQEMPYATATDFCRIFANDMDRLYLLALLLTGDHTMAEKCFVTGLEDSTRRNTVFKEWAQSWARRKIIQNAIEMVRPKPRTGGTPLRGERNSSSAKHESAEIPAVIALPAFERFVFVMSVLERYPVHDCSILLSCTRGDVVEARIRALQQIGRSAEHRGPVLDVNSEERFREADRELMPQLEPLAHLAVSA